MSIPAAAAKSLWIDAPFAETRIQSIASAGLKQAARVLHDLRHRGYAIIPNAVDHSHIDRYLSDFTDSVTENREMLASLGSDIFPLLGRELRTPLLKVLDTHAKIRSATSIIFDSKITEVLQLVFDEKPLAFQTLHFELGSTQAVHQDTAYVVLSEPKRLIATWVALEDVTIGSGELVYYPGSHTMGEFLYPGGRKHWVPEKDGQDIHNHHLFWLHERARELGLKQERFLAKKGDVLFWHADLAHGGAPITDPYATRRSLVTHYAPASSNPHYFRDIPTERQKKVDFAGLGYMSSYFYEL